MFLVVSDAASVHWAPCDHLGVRLVGQRTWAQSSYWLSRLRERHGLSSDVLPRSDREEQGVCTGHHHDLYSCHWRCNGVVHFPLLWFPHLQRGANSNVGLLMKLDMDGDLQKGVGWKGIYTTWLFSSYQLYFRISGVQRGKNKSSRWLLAIVCAWLENPPHLWSATSMQVNGASWL